VRRLELTDIARADLKSIRRYSERTWGSDRTTQYMAALRDTMKRLLAGTVVSRSRDDLRPGLQMAASGRHRVFFEIDQNLQTLNYFRRHRTISDGILIGRFVRTLCELGAVSLDHHCAAACAAAGLRPSLASGARSPGSEAARAQVSPA
jgi:toxin ParE1/3/4